MAELMNKSVTPSKAVCDEMFLAFPKEGMEPKAWRGCLEWATTYAPLGSEFEISPETKQNGEGRTQTGRNREENDLR